MGVRIEQEDHFFEQLQRLKEDAARLWHDCPSEPQAQMMINQVAYYIRKCRDEHHRKEMADAQQHVD